MTNRTYKIVPVEAKPTETKIRELREFLAANVDVAIVDNDPQKAAVFQQHLDLVELLVEHSRDRI
ncbi:hypothetical protein [Streptomyces sp. NPDC052042]|uniref:hypothetical protein n=1 Tax=Streptomyces sp. NPDC052042 TaxID=3365683 RepID=UPI0037D9552E